MYNHEPENYDCPLCTILNGKDNPDAYSKVDDFFYKDNYVTAFIGGKWWPKNPGSTIVIPNFHYENIFDLPNEFGHKIFDVSKRVAVALKEVYQCDGVTIRQHNEQAGDQEAWHYHLHVIPRYANDDLSSKFNNTRWTTAEERAPYVKKLKKYFIERV